MSDLSSALKGPAPTREYLTALTELPISELDKAKERHQQEGSLTPELDTFFNVVEREKANDILARWSAPEVDENSVIYDAEQLFRSGQLPARYEPLINQVVREKIKDSKQVGILDTAGRIIKALPGAAPEAATQMFQSAVENVQTALGETPKSLAGLAFAKLSGDKELERAALELGMRAGARTASGTEAETRESAGFLSRGLPRLYDFVGSMLSKGQVQVGPMLALTAATEARKALSGAGEAAQLSAKREAALTDDKALAEFVGTRRQQEAKIQEAREFKGAAAKLIGADIESLKAAGVELKPEDYDRAQKAGVLLDLTEPAFVPFALGASVTGRSLRKMTSSVLRELGAGKLAAAVAEKAPSVAPRTVALGRLVKTAEQVADEARQYDTVLRKIRVASGNALVKTGEKIQQIPLPVGSPLLVAGGVLASGGDVNTAGVAAVTAAGARYLLGSRLGVKAAGKIAKGAGEVLRYTPGIDSPWEAVRRASIDLRRDMVRAAGAGVAEGSLYALDPAASPEAKAAIISSGLTMAPAGALTARAGDWAKHGMLFSPRLGRPDSISGLPAAPRSYGTESDAFNLSNFNKLSEDSTIFLRSLQDLMGDNGGLYVATTPQEFQTLVAQRTRQTPGQPPLLVPEGVQGMALKPHQTTSGKAEAIINLSNSVNESAGHEVTHALLYALEASGPEGAAKVQAIRDQAYKSLGGPSSSRFQQVKTKYAEALGQQIGDDVAIDEWIAEHGSVVLAGLPVGKLGADKGVVKGLYDALFTLAEALELRVPGYQQGATGPVTSQTLKYSPSVSLLNALDNLFYAYKLENDAAVPAPEAAVGVPPVIAPEGVQNVEVVTPPAPVAGFKKGDPIGNITNPQGELVFSGAKVWADSQGPTVRIEGVDASGNIVRADVPRAWLESKAGTAVPPVDVGATVPVPATLTEQPAVPAPGSISGIPPKAPAAPKPTVAKVTEQKRQTVAGVATPELQAQNEGVLAQNLNKPVEVDYLSAVAGEESGDAAVRLRERQLADRNEQEGVPNPFRTIYGKVVVPTSIFEAANGKRMIYGFSPDKLIRNIDQLRGWYLERGDKAKADYLYSPEFQKQVRNYLENQSNGYRGDGEKIVRPEDTDPARYPAENPNYTPVAVAPETRNLINFLMGLDPVSPVSVVGAWVVKLAELNGFKPASYEAGKRAPKPYFNPLVQQLRAAGFDGKLNSAIEQLRIERMVGPAVPRPDLASVKPAVQGSVQAGFMPEAANRDTLIRRVGVADEDGVRSRIGTAIRHKDFGKIDGDVMRWRFDPATGELFWWGTPSEVVRENVLAHLARKKETVVKETDISTNPEALRRAEPGFTPAYMPEGRRELVNVGLKIGNKISLTKEDVIKAFADEGITLENVQVRESGTEPTVIAAVRGADKAAIDRASNTLQQDAIAVYNPADDTGYLAGPRPENFGGKFLKEYFLMPEEPAFMPAPLVESEAFKKWFGDSKVVDADGKPLVVYHGTRAAAVPETFDREKISRNDPDIPVRGFWFALDRQEAKMYGNGPVGAFYLSAQKLADRAKVWEVAKTQQTTEEITQELIRQGYDGVEFIAPRFWTEASIVAAEKELADTGKVVMGSRELRADADGGVSLWQNGEHITGYYDVRDFAKQDRSSSGYYSIFSPDNIRSATGQPAMMPKAKKPLKGSLGKGSLKFFHYSDSPNKGQIDPKHFGKSGVTGAREQAGLPRAYAYAEGSTLGQDAGLVDARKHYYEGSVPKGQIYDGVEDVLGYGDMANRAKADQMLIDKGFVGIYREGLNGVKQLEFFRPMNVTEAEKPATTGPLAEEATPILPPLALEEIDYAAQDREFARKKAAGEPLYMPEIQKRIIDSIPQEGKDYVIHPLGTTADKISFNKAYITPDGQWITTLGRMHDSLFYAVVNSVEDTFGEGSPEWRNFKMGFGVVNGGDTVYVRTWGDGAELTTAQKRELKNYAVESGKRLVEETVRSGRPREIVHYSPENYDSRYMPKATEAQETAFKDSKVRNEDGSLKPMFHFTTADFNRFGRGDLGYHFGTAEQALSRGKSTGAILEWADGLSAREGGRTIPVYLNLENPLRTQDVGAWSDPEEVYDAIPAKQRAAFPSATRKAVADFVQWRENYSFNTEKFNAEEPAKAAEALGRIRDGLKMQGYDGIVYRNEYESKDQGEDSYIAFDNDQIMPAFTTDTGARWMPEGPTAPEAPLAGETLSAPRGVLNPPKNTALSLLYGENPELKAPEGGQTNTGVAKQLMAAAIEENGRKITSKDITPDEEERLSHTVADEAQEALKQTGHAGDWYTKAIKRMLKVARTIFPELADDAAAKSAGFPDAKRAELGLMVALAVTSQNLSVPDNARYAVEQFNILKETGRFDPSRTYGAKGEAISSNLELANTFVDKFGWEGLEAFIGKNFTVGDLSKVISDILGEEVTIAGRVDDVVQGAAIFGPKIGQGFLQNLLGNLFPVTVDLWLRRTWGRLTGDVMPEAVTSRQLAAMIDAYREQGIPLPPELKSLRVVTRQTKSGKSVRRDLTPESYQRILETPAMLSAVDKLAEDKFSDWNRTYKELRLGMDPQWVTDYREGRVTLEDLNRRQQAVLRARERAWDRHVEQAKRTGAKKGSKNDFLVALDEREGRTAKLSNKDLSSGKPDWAKTTAVVFNARKPIDVPTDQDRAVITRVINRARAILAEQGIETTNADIQATIWYPEKDIWAKLRGEDESDLKNSYDEEFLKIADARGLGEAARAALGELGND